MGSYASVVVFIGTKHRVWRRQWHPTPVLLPGKSHGRGSLVGCSPWSLKLLDTTERLHFHFSLSCIGEGNGKPLQCSCLENPRDGGAWWAAISGIAQSLTQLKRLSSSSSSKHSADYLVNLWGFSVECSLLWFLSSWFPVDHCASSLWSLSFVLNTKSWSQS